MSATEEIALFLPLFAPWLLGPALITAGARILFGRQWALRINSIFVVVFGVIFLAVFALLAADVLAVIGSPNDPWGPALLVLGVMCAMAALCSAVAGRILVTFPRQ